VPSLHIGILGWDDSNGIGQWEAFSIRTKHHLRIFSHVYLLFANEHEENKNLSGMANLIWGAVVFIKPIEKHQLYHKYAAWNESWRLPTAIIMHELGHCIMRGDHCTKAVWCVMRAKVTEAVLEPIEWEGPTPYPTYCAYCKNAINLPGWSAIT
jgi:hypothetical protein